MKRKKKIVLVAHCLLNVNAKVYGIAGDEGGSSFIGELIARGYGIIQLPCVEMAMFGIKRWGIVYEQSDFPAFRSKCRELLSPIILQVKDFYQHGYDIHAVVGADLSPTCGVNITCRGDWGSELSGNERLQEQIDSIQNVPGMGVMMEELKAMLDEAGIETNFYAINETDMSSYQSLLEYF